MNFPIQGQHIQVAGFSIKLFVPDPEAVKEAYQKEEISFPYWSKVWPSAKTLAQFIQKNPAYVKGKEVLELGAGLGLPSLVAAHYAAHVLCTDAAAEAVEIAARSAAHLGLKNFATQVADWQDLPPEMKADVLLLSDVNYAPQAFAPLQKIIFTFLENGTTILLTTPQRLVAKEFVAPLLKHCIHQEESMIIHGEENVPVSTLVLQQKKT